MDRADGAFECDVLVLGSGAGGLTAAVVARLNGLDVLVIEKERLAGGTTALSGGWLWIPCNPHARRAGIEDGPERAREYLRQEAGERFDAARIDAFLEHGPRMVELLEARTEVKFMLGPPYPDYHPDRPGGLPGGRSIVAQPFDGRALGARLGGLRPPAREMTLFGLKVGTGPDFHHFFNARRSPASALYVLRRIARHATDVAIHGRDLLLMSGNALCGRLLKSAHDLGVGLWLGAKAVELLARDGRVTGARVRRDGREVRVLARRGVVCATGGFARDRARRKRLYAHAPEESEHYSLTAPGSTGDGIAMAEAVGAAFDDTLAHAAPWMPVSRVPYRDGTFGVYPHSYERGKPGSIAVGADGRRFVNEANSYHDVVGAMIARRAKAGPPCAHLVCDHRFIQRYGLGMAKPFPVPLGPYLRSGYLNRAPTLEELAMKIGVDAAALEATVDDFNRHALRGEDPLFRRGANAYNRYLGDPQNAPNPCLAPIAIAPFYAVRMVPGDLGTFLGLRTDAGARVLDREGRAIPGLFAAGNDMASPFGGSYPGPGANIGPAMTFGYIAGMRLAE